MTGWEGEVRVLEERLLEASVRRDRAVVGELLGEEFQEFGSSGRVWDREETLRALAEESGQGRRWLADFSARDLAEGVVLVTYRAFREGAGAGPEGRVRETLRSSVWVRREGRWVMVFHQGTVA